MLKKPVWACLFGVMVTTVFLLAGQLMARLPLTLTPWGGALVELALAALAALGLLALRKRRVLLWRSDGFLEGLKAGGFLVAYLSLVVVSAAALWEREPVSELEVFRFVAYMFAIGLAEELTFRGVIQNVLADAFGRDTPQGIRAAVVVSGLIFGMAHLTNAAAGVSIPGAVMQAIIASAMEMYLGAIYARSGNIWFLVLLHGFNDLAGMMVSSGIEGVTLVEEISSYGPERLAGAALYLGLTAFLLRRKKMDKIIGM